MALLYVEFVKMINNEIDGLTKKLEKEKKCLTENPNDSIIKDRVVMIEQQIEILDNELKTLRKHLFGS